MSRQAASLFRPANSKSVSNTLFHPDTQTYLGYLSTIYTLLKQVENPVQQGEKVAIANILIGISMQLSSLPHKGVMIVMSKCPEGTASAVSSLPRWLRGLAAVLKDALPNPDSLEGILSDSLVVEVKREMPLLFKNFIYYYLREKFVDKSHFFIMGVDYFKSMREEVMIDLKKH